MNELQQYPKIVNKIFPQLIDRGFNKHDRWHDGWNWVYEKNCLILIKPYLPSKIITLRLFQEYIHFNCQKETGYHFVSDSASEKYEDMTIDKILNKVDRWVNE